MRIFAVLMLHQISKQQWQIIGRKKQKGKYGISSMPPLTQDKL